ncbi:hypothetical protein CALCODRAFT_513388 [Calocera cornea HHB12733]|uniref:Uncharacterized protein n=1 Tax=Calocera cornea HHB12733 TaxID=1353952 RepID=A0A165C5M9_9BASI|nr:hypothetical protein CALCODRAFT_513388 [Calocera cornea HHB12733]
MTTGWPHNWIGVVQVLESMPFCNLDGTLLYPSQWMILISDGTTCANMVAGWEMTKRLEREPIVPFTVVQVERGVIRKLSHIVLLFEEGEGGRPSFQTGKLTGIKYQSLLAGGQRAPAYKIWVKWRDCDTSMVWFSKEQPASIMFITHDETAEIDGIVWQDMAHHMAQLHVGLQISNNPIIPLVFHKFCRLNTLEAFPANCLVEVIAIIMLIGKPIIGKSNKPVRGG